MAQCLTLLVVLATIIGANGAPSPTEEATAVKTSYCAHFDDLPQNPGAFDDRIDPVGTYKGISYLGFFVATQKNSGIDYFNIPSKPNIIDSGSDSESAFGGSPALQINTTATGSRSDSFDLTSLRFACLLQNGIEVAYPFGCTVLFEGIKRSGAKSVSYEYEYFTQSEFTGAPPANLSTVKFPAGFTRLSEVFLTVTAVPNGIIGPNPILDNVCLSINGVK